MIKPHTPPDLGLPRGRIPHELRATAPSSFQMDCLQHLCVGCHSLLHGSCPELCESHGRSVVSPSERRSSQHHAETLHKRTASSVCSNQPSRLLSPWLPRSGTARMSRERGWVSDKTASRLAGSLTAPPRHPDPGIWFSFNFLSQILGACMAYGLAIANQSGKLSIPGWKVMFIFWAHSLRLVVLFWLSSFPTLRSMRVSSGRTRGKWRWTASGATSRVSATRSSSYTRSRRRSLTLWWVVMRAR